MRVAINGYFWDQPRTGSGQYLRHLRRTLSELPTASELDLTVLVPGGADDGRWTADDEAKDAGSSNPIVHRPSSIVRRRLPTPLAKTTWETWGIMTEARRRGAVLLHVPYFSAPLARQIPVVVTAHDMIPWVVPGYEGTPAVRLYLALAAAAVKRASLIIADSEASRLDVLRVLKVSPRKVHTVYLGALPTPNYPPEQLEDVRSRHGLPADFAFYIGGFDLRKNVPLLLRAWSGAAGRLAAQRCSEARPLLAVGGTLPAPGGIFPDVRAEAARLGLLTGETSTVRFLGGLSDEDKSLLMAAARVFIYPSAYEGFGLDPLQAMSAGCAVVSSSGGSLREVVGAAGLLVPPNDWSALRDAIVHVWTNDALRSHLGRAGKARAATFTWRRTAERTAALYSLALRRSRRS